MHIYEATKAHLQAILSGIFTSHAGTAASATLAFYRARHADDDGH